LDDTMKALDEYFGAIEEILKSGEQPDHMTQEIRDALMFYTAHQARITNGTVRNNTEELRLHRWLIAVILAIIAVLHGLPFLPLP
jgi:hypothetical protein